jgi:hypothetical protein
MSAQATGLVSLFGLDPATYQPHLVHSGERAYLETNCYTDILVELLHARGDEPLAAMGFLVRMDFEGDQWTFFKPPLEDLERLFGVDVHEMQPYRGLPTTIAEQIARGRTIITELDSWYLPDTAATAYRNQHVKTGVIAEAIDVEGEYFRYFHNASLYELDGEDYRGVFRLGRDFSADVLPPYTELVRFDAGERLEGEQLRAASLELLRGHLRHRPRVNPFESFGDYLGQELPRLLEGDDATYHAFAFATVRMAGSAFEIASSHVDWLFGADGAGPSASFRAIVNGCKMLSFKLARRRAFDPEPAVAGLVGSWDSALTALDRLTK